MKLSLEPTALSGVLLVAANAAVDERGHFQRLYSSTDFAAFGIQTPLPVTARAFNRRAFTLRGLHFQRAPHEETKVVSCASGRIFDVVVDLRPRSATYRRWIGIILSGDATDGPASVHVPPGCAHGYLTLTDAATVIYQTSDTYRADAESGVRWDDPTLAIAWPTSPVVMSERDRALPLLPAS